MRTDAARNVMWVQTDGKYKANYSLGARFPIEQDNDTPAGAFIAPRCTIPMRSVADRETMAHSQ
jgi:hypothetical protein